MKKINTLLFVLFGLLFSITGCQKKTDQEVNPVNQNDGFLLKNGYMAFENEKSYTSYVNWIIFNQNNPDLINLKNNELGLISMNSVYEEGMRIEDESLFKSFVSEHPNAFHKVEIESSIIYELPAPNALSYIANENGIYQIGDKIYRLAYDYYFELSQDNISKFDKLLLPVSKINDPDIEVTRTRDASFKTQMSYKTSYFPNTDYRMVARMERFNSPIQGKILEARITSQRKGWTGIWVQHSIPEIGQYHSQAYVQFLGWSSGTFYNANSITRFNSSDSKWSYFDELHSIDYSVSYWLMNHYGVDVHGNRVSILNNQALIIP